jgi:hypothetical protein
VAHVELSWESPVGGATWISDSNSLRHWASTVAGAYEPCMVVDLDARIAAASMPACRLLGFNGPADAIGRSLHARALPLLDFTSEGSPLSDEDLPRIPPIIALSSRLLARGVLRVRTRDGQIVTMDAVSTPLRDHEHVVGSLTFFCEV